MNRGDLSEAEWGLLEPLLPPNQGLGGRRDDRRVVNGILWRIRTGGQWSDLPAKYGKPISVYQRFRRWGAAGIWKAAAKAAARSLAECAFDDPDLTAIHDDLQAMVELADRLLAGRRARSRAKPIVSKMPEAPVASFTPCSAKRRAAGHKYRYVRHSKRKTAG